MAVDDDKTTRPVSQDQLLEKRKKVELSRIIISKGLFTFIYLFIYKLRQEAWIPHRVSSTTKSKGSY